MLSLALVLATAYPITKIGVSCPYGYYSQGSYCLPNAAMQRPVRAVPQTSSPCPYGTYSAGNYCTWTPKR
jgi:hypothetical protein